MTAPVPPVPPALCWDRAWKYEPAATHDDASLFRARQLERLLQAQPRRDDDREAA
jgi:hypothetical protein